MQQIKDQIFDQGVCVDFFGIVPPSPPPIRPPSFSHLARALFPDVGAFVQNFVLYSAAVGFSAFKARCEKVCYGQRRKGFLDVDASLPELGDQGDDSFVELHHSVFGGILPDLRK